MSAQARRRSRDRRRLSAAVGDPDGRLVLLRGVVGVGRVARAGGEAVAVSDVGYEADFDLTGEADRLMLLGPVLDMLELGQIIAVGSLAHTLAPFVDPPVATTEAAAFSIASSVTICDGRTSRRTRSTAIRPHSAAASAFFGESAGIPFRPGGLTPTHSGIVDIVVAGHWPPQGIHGSPVGSPAVRRKAWVPSPQHFCSVAVHQAYEVGNTLSMSSSMSMISKALHPFP